MNDGDGYGPREATRADAEKEHQALEATPLNDPGYLAIEDGYMRSQARQAEALETDWDSPDFATPKQEAEAHWQAGQEAIYGTPAEQAADATLDEAEEIMSAEWGRYLTDTYIFPGPETPEAEAGQ